ncbi:MAG: DUF72 domain-containing protein [Candidatus Krumholzibacteria bacterium]|nr:DUF72 domain-containing protein [Candidatus Krumholzibacteria bacterium]
MAEKRQGISNVFIGPAGWSYKDWVGPVYPPGRSTDQLLTIARYFNCIELNSSFYRPPNKRLVESWCMRLSANPDFKLTVKVWRRFTHEMKGTHYEAKKFVHSFDSLAENGKLGAFLLQFPWSFKNDPENRRYLKRLGSWFNEYPTAVEFRHGSWDSPDTLKILSDHNLAFCNIDQPMIGRSIPPTEYVTDMRLGYIRLHGRNRNNWFRSDAGRDERYDYLYCDGELKEWRNRAQKIIRKAKNLFIITNNHFRGQALVNAFQLRYLLEERKRHVPSRLKSAFPVLGDIALQAYSQSELLEDL